MTLDHAQREVEKRRVLEECISTVHKEATEMAEKMLPPEEIQATIQSIARAFLDSSKMFDQGEIETVVGSMRVGRRD